MDYIIQDLHVTPDVEELIGLKKCVAYEIKVGMDFATSSSIPMGNSADLVLSLLIVYA